MWFAFRLIAQLTLELLWPTVSCLIELFRFGLSGRGRKHYQRLSFTAWKLMGSSFSTISCVFQSLYIKVRDIQPNSRQWVGQENACHLGACCIILLHPFFPFLFLHRPENHRLQVTWLLVKMGAAGRKSMAHTWEGQCVFLMEKRTRCHTQPLRTNWRVVAALSSTLTRAVSCMHWSVTIVLLLLNWPS